MRRLRGKPGGVTGKAGIWGLNAAVELPGRRDVYSNFAQHQENPMSKGMDQKKQTKKKPAKTFAEKRAAKREKRQARGR